jgi:tetratricopeptide (TPR) repeat protein
MKTTVVFLLATLLFTDLDKIGKINSAKAEAKKAFLAGDFTTAIKKYTYLIDSLGVNEDEVRANLASAYFQANDTTGALNNYQRLTQSANKKISSVANQQLGVMANNQEKLEESLNYFKQALKASPENDEARYNYEIVKKKLEKKEADKKKKDQEQKNKNQEPSEFAKKLKAKADELVSQKLYKQAYDLMIDGLKKDQTVSSFQNFIDRTKEVIDIK